MGRTDVDRPRLRGRSVKIRSVQGSTLRIQTNADIGSRGHFLENMKRHAFEVRNEAGELRGRHNVLTYLVRRLRPGEQARLLLSAPLLHNMKAGRG